MSTLGIHGHLSSCRARQEFYVYVLTAYRRRVCYESGVPTRCGLEKPAYSLHLPTGLGGVAAEVGCSGEDEIPSTASADPLLSKLGQGRSTEGSPSFLSRDRVTNEFGISRVLTPDVSPFELPFARVVGKQCTRGKPTAVASKRDQP